ncbi:MAG TPA: MaoC family dehydratase N-terminal domain-containing protein [Methylomirabilota bacterium]|nr:MaoC family dehydratase N-terminal domain-containing protein [Methylomirabilota bacterium]
MAIDMAALGKETAWTESVVTHEAIRAFCESLEDYNELFLNAGAARAAGGDGVVAPPTFINTFRTGKTALLLSELNFPLPKLLHGEQTIWYHRPMRPGDRIFHRVKVIEVGRKPSKTYGQLDYFTVLITCKNERGEKVVEATQLFFVHD